ncbi:UDP-N-acetylmuramoylalanyl-D-glutamyl-2,6-diaminopimelate--D-alanyl-D-alanine ligase [Rhodoplanes sp. TEM]|uniref:UDP-N-acetylmuramoyl-tripeptide--D-alanyl-D-alanine ligase n=1 Tax=Rhodoplanes tepidamans TaxID=200616 RepID=A0ABT5J6V7_RHOTP|nr:MULTISPECIES: UDP-N-acetylmuramoylalanyl-D-glutamyl-2,6-diaminopimelate--D-alanyl-D-alanine ligase [Rhodoplanes]MDC7785382.1 UDP-N-acetylmuramoylalanyl-D-glutamyl-2,6-diaminopimelate--D-alanyl-D-alanine ligase [Rhodoplanes tepidamans]MDC7984341.1 UDP-N-acetylmuramoylalanyl-D-glutamyl-2,6-diaminopimelate--D-alanyl-D-alanine ligase [Rhodoplanes sp. TEM]MDQ0353165.1 UDP-N-acetylmuramoyl-tripeptide--D-alanyl-D-alanine ligase [Rhodoplanes tepidamans]
MTTPPLWTVGDMAAAMSAEGSGPLPAAIVGLSIDSRTVSTGEAFFAIVGERLDGHDFVAKALANGAALAVVSQARRAEFPADAPLLVVPDVLEGLRHLARAARARSPARVIAVTGSVGKTSTKEALRVALRADGETHASTASFNNHWGVPLSLARLPETARYAVFEIGMNHAGEITPLVALVRPHVAIVTTVEPVHLEFFPDVAAIADAKAEIFGGLEPGGAAVINRDNPHFERLKRRAAQAGVERIVSFGENAKADARLLKYALQDDGSTVEASILGSVVDYRIGAPGRHFVLNSLAVLAAASLAGADLALCALALAGQRPAAGRGTRMELAIPGGRALLIDESYNANPTSMRAALAVLGRAPVHGRGRRIAVLGDMLELGAAATGLHAGLAEAVVESGVDLVFCAGPLMRALWDALPADRRGGWAANSEELEPQVLAEIQPGDAVMVKGSLGSRMGPIVKALARRYPAPAASDDLPVRG